jgi:hypothetical protein
MKVHEVIVESFCGYAIVVSSHQQSGKDKRRDRRDRRGIDRILLEPGTFAVT